MSAATRVRSALEIPPMEGALMKGREAQRVVAKAACVNAKAGKEEDDDDMSLSCLLLV